MVRRATRRSEIELKHINDTLLCEYLYCAGHASSTDWKMAKTLRMKVPVTDSTDVPPSSSFRLSSASPPLGWHDRWPDQVHSSVEVGSRLCEGLVGRAGEHSVLWRLHCSGAKSTQAFLLRHGQFRDPIALAMAVAWLER